MIKLIFKYEYPIKDKIHSDYYLVELFYCYDSNWYYRLEGSRKLNVTPNPNRECPNINDPIEFIEKTNNFTYVGAEIDHNQIVERYFEDELLEQQEQEEIEEFEKRMATPTITKKENFISNLFKRKKNVKTS